MFPSSFPFCGESILTGTCMYAQYVVNLGFLINKWCTKFKFSSVLFLKADK